ncbi:MAG: hypothetical protein M1818_002759 [Claussenomyces sp. TS43310]|nr:MAG: hypothetical protein M1818_002759 [Claussenomyces sp. TS43310]
MSSSDGARDDTSTDRDSHSKSQKTNTPPLHSLPSNGQPQTKSDIPRVGGKSEGESRRSEVVSSVPLTPPISPPKLPRPTISDIPKARVVSVDEPRSSRVATSVLPTSPTSSYGDESDLTAKEEKLAEIRAQIKISSLKTKLGLDGWQCGCLTQKNTPCTRPIGKGKQDQIYSQIQSMTTLTWSDPELESELDKLVMLVHCHQHDCGNPKDSRIEIWITAFPHGDSDAKPVPSVERQIRKALGRVSTQCIGTKPDGKRCGRGIGGRKVQNCTKTIDEIVKPEVCSDDADLDIFLKVLESNMYCHLHLNCRPLKCVAMWKLSIFEIRKRTASQVAEPTESDAPGRLKNQTRAPRTQETGKTSIGNNSNLALQIRGLPTPRMSRSLSPRLARDPAAFWPATYDTTAFDIIERGDIIADNSVAYELVRSAMLKPLDKKDQEHGFIYLYEVEGNSGFVKLGYTTRSLEIRHQEWDFDCNRAVKVLYPIPSGGATVVPNARRVEALCHAELAYRKIRIYCRGCLKQHIEWFESSAEEATAVVRKWSKWMMTHPYQSTPLGDGVILKEEEKLKAHDIDRFMKEMS